MKVREKIFESIQKMDAGELSLLYKQVKLMEMMKIRPLQKKESLSIKKIHEMTSTSDSSWSDSVLKDREDR